MSKHNSKFLFKEFAVSHHRSSMKVGVDGVMIGCWTDVCSARRILDVGTGCGLIALIVAQRAPEATIDAIDIDEPSIEEATENFSSSPWADRLNARLCSYSEASSLLKDSETKYDLIISNPPYFDSGVKDAVTAREKARHQGELSPLTLLEGAKSLLADNGQVAMVVPLDISAQLEKDAETMGFQLVRKCCYRGHQDAPFKRILLQWKLAASQFHNVGSETTFMTLEEQPGHPTEEYRELCKDFYLRF